MAKIRAHTLFALGCLLAGGLFAASAAAETLQMEDTEQADRSAYEASGRPTRGTTQAQVEASYGAPKSVEDAVGEPPITRWHYDKFVVYFEYDRVIHAVLKR